MPRVSIVIPMFHAQEYLAFTVDSVRGQAFDDWELVLFDDGSRDGTLTLARECASQDARIRAVQGVNGGTARARNRGYACTSPSAEFVIFLDNDDTWEPNALASLVQALDANPASPAAHGLARAVDSMGRHIPEDDLPTRMSHRQVVLQDKGLADLPMGSPTTFEALLVENYPVTPGTTLIRRRVWDDLGGFAPDTVPCDDWDMNLRVARRGGICLVEQVILNWRRHPSAASNTSRRWREAYLSVRRRTVQAADNGPEQRSAALAAYRMSCQQAWSQLGGHLAGGRVLQGSRALVRWARFQTAYWELAHTVVTPH